MKSSIITKRKPAAKGGVSYECAVVRGRQCCGYVGDIFVCSLEDVKVDSVPKS